MKLWSVNPKENTPEQERLAQEFANDCIKAIIPNRVEGQLRLDGGD